MRRTDIRTVDTNRYPLDDSDIERSDQLLSVAEIQDAFRSLRQSRSRPGPTSTLAESRTRSGQISRWQYGAPDTAIHPRECWPDTALGTAETPQIGRLGSDWIAVIAAHAGAGASTVALAITDALSSAGRTARLIDPSQPSRSGLVAAATAELGTDPTGSWRRGSRNTATLYRRASDIDPDCWPTHDSVPLASQVATVVDLGQSSPDTLAQLTAKQSRVVVVCHASMPGLRATEHLLGQLDTQSVVIAAIGASRWPAVLTASLGLKLRIHRDAGEVVNVATERHLQMSGLTAGPLPRPVANAGRALLALLDDTHPRVASTDFHTAIHTRSDPSSTSSTTDERTDR